MLLQVRSYFASVSKPESCDQMFWRGQTGFFGEGEAFRISACGTNRIAELSRLWQELVQKAQVEDQVQLPGSGLMAFSSITFSSESQFESVLIIPAKLTVVRDGVSFVTEISKVEPTNPKTEPNSVFLSGELTSQGFVAATKLAIDKIHSGQLEKVVLARDLVMPLSEEPDLMPALNRLHQRYPECWTYLVADNFGASPELLLRAESGEVSARVLAGTAARGTDPDVDRAIAEGLVHSHKNQHEHQFAVQSLTEELAPSCSAVETDKTFALPLPDLWHLATDVRGKLKPGLNLLDAIARLHPTAAVAGTPRSQAEQLITELEPFDRGGYAGPVGWVSASGSGEMAIALRGGRVERDPLQIRAFAGCGIVAESDPQAELTETELKFRAVKHAFDL